MLAQKAVQEKDGTRLETVLSGGERGGGAEEQGRDGATPAARGAGPKRATALLS